MCKPAPPATPTTPPPANIIADSYNKCNFSRCSDGVRCWAEIIQVTGGTASMKHYQHLCKKERFYIWHALGNTLHLAGLVALPFRLSPSSHSTPERLPRPYSGRPVRLRRIPFQQATNARLPMPDPIPKLLAPLTNGFIGHRDATFGQ